MSLVRVGISRSRFDGTRVARWLVALGLGAAGVLLIGPIGNASKQNQAAIPHPVQPTLLPAYGEESPFDVGLGQAEDGVKFRVLVPSPEAVNGDPEASLLAGPAVVLRYPPPTAGSTKVDQPWISITEQSWDGGDPVSAFNADIERNPDVGKALCEIKGLPAQCSTPFSPSSTGETNPAFVWIVEGGVEVRIAGSDSLDDLKGIAASLRSETSADSSPSSN
jgi:hypothetical protein